MKKTLDIFSNNVRQTNKEAEKAAKNITIEKLLKIGEKTIKQNLPESIQTIFIQQEIMSYLYGNKMQ